MRIENNSDRTVRLGGSVSIAPGKAITLAADAQHLVERPLVQAYLKDRTLTLVDDTARARPAAKPKVEGGGGA
jgi:hypothetical protein